MLATLLLLPILLAIDPSAEGPPLVKTRAASGPVYPQLTLARQVLADIEAGRASEALKTLAGRADDLDPFERHVLTGRAQLLLRHFPQARSAFEAALRLRPQSAETHYRLGLVHFDAGNVGLALACFEKADFHGLDTVGLHEAWARACLKRGEVLGRLHTRPMADAAPGTIVLDDAFAVVRKAPPPARGFVLAPRGSAVYHSCRCIHMQPARGDLRLLMADVWAAAGLRDQAAAEYARAAAVLDESQRGPCLGRWAECLLSARDYDGYFARLREWMALPGGPSAHELAEAYARVADAMREAGDARKQARYLTFAVEIEPESADWRIALAEALGWAGRRADAVDEYREALRLAPDHARRDEIRQRIREWQAAASQP